jgi:F-type H+-transporting ATPase subunit a
MEVHVELAAETLWEIGPVHITNSMFMMFVVMALILIVFTIIARGAKYIPGRAQGVVEMIVEFILDLVEGTAGRRIGRRIFPLVAGIFIFILFANFSGLLPGVGTITLDKGDDSHAEETALVAQAETESETDSDEAHAETDEAHAETAAGEEEHHSTAVPIMRPPTADLNMTLAMSLLTFVVVQIAGVSAHGIGGRIKHMADPPFLFPIEVISELSRIISLAARLFGNVFAGEVLLGVMYGMANAIKIALVPVAFPVVFIFLEVLFGTIQALVFALLTLIYITLAAAGHDDHEHEAAPAHAPTDATTAGTASASAGD